MLDRQKGDIVFECDGCGEVLETDTEDFNAARNLLTVAGWRTRKIGPNWCHFCEGCAKQAA